VPVVRMRAVRLVPVVRMRAKRLVPVVRMRVVRLVPVVRMRAKRLVPVAWMGAVRPASAQAMLLRMTAVPVGATWALPARMTPRLVKAVRVVLSRTHAAPTLVPLGVPPSRVEKLAQGKAPPSACRARP
jgi:hypothetical protein